MSNNIFLTGYNGVGKSTLVKQVINEIGVRPGGFFSLGRVEGQSEILIIYPADNSTDKKDGKVFAIRNNKCEPWKINVNIFNKYGSRLLEEGLKKRELIIMDELGRFEIKALNFQKKVFKALSDNTPVLGVIKYERNSFLKKIWDNPEVQVFWVDNDNRQEVLYRLISLIKPFFQIR